MNFKQMLQRAIPGWNGKLAAHHIGYMGDMHPHRGFSFSPSGTLLPYNPLDQKVMTKKLQLMQSIGVDTVIVTWQGPLAGACHMDAILVSELVGLMGMDFMLLIDPWCAKLGKGGATANVASALNSPTTMAMLTARDYVPEKYILNFDKTGANLALLAAQFPSFIFLDYDIGFGWPMIPWNAANYAAMNAKATMMIPGICGEFNDSGAPLPLGVSTLSAWLAAGGQRDYSQSVWGTDGKTPARVLDPQAGQFLASQLATISPSAPYIAIVTWDDFDERSSGPLENFVAEANGVDWSKL